MAKIDVLNLEGKKTGSLELADEVFGGINEDLLWEAVKHYRAAQRAGTHATKNKKLVSGAGKKLWKQKGTGRARVGSIRSPIWRHGGTVHGPVPRDYSYSLPRKMQLGALRSALSAQLRDGNLQVVSAFALTDHKTKSFAKSIGKFEGSKKLLLVEAAENRNLELSARNIEGVEIVRSHEVHPYHLLGATRILFTKDAAVKLSESLAKSAPALKEESN